jgi:hypothetical protein
MESERKMNLYQTATVLFVLVFVSLENGWVMGQCVRNPVNVAVWEGTQNVSRKCAPNPDQVYWICYPTSDELENAKINDESGVVASDARSQYKIDPEGLTILEATIYEGTNKYSTAGICLGLHGNETRLVGAKLIVVHDGPVCTLNVTSPSNGVPVRLRCTCSYADHSVHPVRPVFQVKVGDDYILYETIIPERINQYIFVAEKIIEMAYNACVPLIITMEFDPPTDIQYDFIAQNKPDFSSTVRFEATSDDCLRDVANVAVLEGTHDVIVGSSRDPQTLQRRVSPSSDQLSDLPISDYDKGVFPNMMQYYSESKKGLIIATATAVTTGNRMTTAGIYTEKDKSGKLKGFKVIVVRGLPTCSSNVSDANPPKKGDTVKLTCVAIFADHSLHQINPRMTLTRNSVPRSTTSPSKSISSDGNTFVVTAEFIVNYDPSEADTCTFSFDPPPSDDGYDYIASNTPHFSASCNFYNVNG